MKIACFTFTESGRNIANNLKTDLDCPVDILSKEITKNNLKEMVKTAFDSYDALIFISSTGIAVRLIAPYIEDKTTDPAVVVIDDLGRYAISLLSGHLGGANELAERISIIIKSLPVITTASDGRGIEAVDMFAKRNGLLIENMEDAKIITAMMIEGRPVKLVSEVAVNINYHNLNSIEPAGLIIVTSEEINNMNKPYCLLRPRNLNIGIGCRRGKSKEEILTAIVQVFKEHKLSISSIKRVGSIDIKKDEMGIIEACRELNIEFKTFAGEEIKRVENRFAKSDFVLKNVGVSSVSESCAYLLGGNIIVGKTAVGGVTVAVSKED